MKSSASPAISVVIPVHNRAKCVGDALESTLSQDIPDVEVICVDDASTDDSAAVLAAWDAKDSRVRVITLPENGGTGVARKTGILAARGEFTLCLDSDDRFLPGVFGRLLSTMRSRGVDVLQYRVRSIPLGVTRPQFARYFQRLLDFHLRARRAGDWRLLRDQSRTVEKTHWVVWNKIYRTEPLQRAARLQEDGWMVAGEDMLLTVILQSFLPSWGSTRLRCLEYRCGEGSIRDVQMTPEIFDWKLNRADCCRALKRFCDAAVEEAIPGVLGPEGNERTLAAPLSTRRFVRYLAKLCNRLVQDRMEITWRQIPADASEDELRVYHGKFYAAWGPGLCHRFFSSGTSCLHTRETPTFRFGAALLTPVTVPLALLRAIQAARKRKAERKAAEEREGGHA